MNLRPGIDDVTPKHVAAAEAIVGALGGPANITSLEHCVTRLRIALADLRLLDDTRLRSHPAVLGVLRRETLQIVVGPAAVTPLATAMAQLLTAAAADDTP
ncbi:PTS glucose/sucrose transporter subunit IIB [Dactylosporangium sp. NPDC000244]|uniref:PTS glucose/sucrose transporter subunit IIB n=1 Tax=Dactylosporangium sp. NPDC000244 TaxID=3154365 RepID=UPI00331E16F9